MILKPNKNQASIMDTTMALPELMYLSPTTREKAVMIAQDLLRAGNISPKEAISKAVLIAKNWAVKNVNRRVWKKLKSNDKESI
ncbi:hypothetical protein DYBT9275_01980 [Dyadobacter sp. CECT 9275]|uniref:Uncharacterized protein n=2 Tax=Dyadobacter helix TaxID=2822344 RepID=A0A916JAF9_9BACT|nr:hypothetical protein DYBT9275_01980 [Dyadobacter sp. CECT 9275]